MQGGGAREHRGKGGEVASAIDSVVKSESLRAAVAISFGVGLQGLGPPGRVGASEVGVVDDLHWKWRPNEAARYGSKTSLRFG